MKFFIDTAKVEDIKKANDMGVICGVTTNPSLIAKEGRVFEEVIAEIASIVDGPISGEVKATTTECGRDDQGRKRDRQDPSQYGGKDPDDGRRAESLPSVVQGRDQDQCDLDIYGESGAAGSEGGSGVCFSVPGTSG